MFSIIQIMLFFVKNPMSNQALACESRLGEFDNKSLCVVMALRCVSFVCGDASAQ